jgi:hypothetical protein
MTKNHHTRMIQAAYELVRLDQAGSTVDADMLVWARQIVANNPPRAPFKPSPIQDSIFKLLDEAPFDGLTAEQLALKTGIAKNLMSSTLSYMVNTTGVICSIKLPRMSIYFRDQKALEIGRPIVMAAEECRRVLREVKLPRPPMPSAEERLQARAAAKAALHEKREAEKQERKLSQQQREAMARQIRLDERAAAKAARPVRQPKPKHVPKPKPHQVMTVKQQPNVIIHVPRKPTINESVFIPPGLQVQQLPSGRDTRYDPDPNSEGAGFSSEWKRLRGEV